jgi:hypothetical protein
MRLPSTSILAAFVLLTALSHTGFAQSDPLIGTWRLNLAKSKFDPGPAPRSSIMHYERAGQGFRAGVIGYDASAFTRVDDHTVTYVRTLAGKVVATGTRVLSRDGKTLTFTGTGASAMGRQYNVAVYDKQ